MRAKDVNPRARRQGQKSVGEKRTLEVHIIRPGEIVLRGESSMRLPDRARKVVKDYVGPDDPGVIILGGPKVGRNPILSEDETATLRDWYEAHERSHARKPRRDEMISAIITRAEEMGVVISYDIALRKILNPVRRKLYPKR
jgi:hypothetical protein